MLCALAVFMFVMFANNMYHMSLAPLSSPAPFVATLLQPGVCSVDFCLDFQAEVLRKALLRCVIGCGPNRRDWLLMARAAAHYADSAIDGSYKCRLCGAHPFQEDCVSFVPDPGDPDEAALKWQTPDFCGTRRAEARSSTRESR